ncbi:HD domain-containing protein [Nocardiopsis synnemataformans]|uniref:HD domain-containing protein n=1 Tax=Nocardiopsis synnemataformans TaxID=61305 RepID=UPI003EBD30F0
MNLAEATALALQAHGGQTDKAGHPYVRHVIAVRDLLAPHGDYAQIAGVLHDVLEDTPLTAADLAARGCPPQVLDALDAVTRRPNEDYTAAVRRAAAHPLGRLVKLADNLHNSDPERLAELPTAVAERLTAKYTAARALLVVPGRDIHTVTPRATPATAIYWDGTNALAVAATLGLDRFTNDLSIGALGVDRFTYLTPSDPQTNAAYRDCHGAWVPIPSHTWLVLDQDQNIHHLDTKEFALTYEQEPTW